MTSGMETAVINLFTSISNVLDTLNEQVRKEYNMDGDSNEEVHVDQDEEPIKARPRRRRRTS